MRIIGFMLLLSLQKFSYLENSSTSRTLPTERIAIRIFLVPQWNAAIHIYRLRPFVAG